MAAEIASSAVDNGRWHHAAASRALEQQLSPENSSLMSKTSFQSNLSRGFKNSKSIFRSLSSANFKSLAENSSSSKPGDFERALTSDESCDFDRSLNKLPEPMAQSSGSESSTDSAGEEEREECEKWAAEFIAGTLFSQSIPISNSPARQRSISYTHSYSSDDSSHSDDSSELSKSPVGFWSVPPSASKGCSARYEDDITWSPHVSPNTSVRDIQSSCCRDRKVTFDTSGLPSLDFNKTKCQFSHEDGNSESLSKTFQKETKLNEIVCNNGKLDTKLPDLTLPCGMKRSLSYSGFKRISDNKSIELIGVKSTTSRADTSHEYGMYFQKFINLLIDRETTPTTKN